MSNFCGNCGASRTPGAKFCGGCGAPLPVDPSHCPTCGQTLPLGLRLADAAPAIGQPAAPAFSRGAHMTNPPGLVYGADFVEGTDCWNCGNPDVQSGVDCPLCGFQR